MAKNMPPYDLTPDQKKGLTSSNQPSSQPEVSLVKPGVLFVVDDEVMVTTSIQTMLELETSHRVLTFNRPDEALKALTKETPDLVISDFLMPKMDGIAFLEKVKRVLPEATLILLTGYADKENAIAAINSVGIYKYIEKPWDNESLKLTIHNGLERSRLLANLRTTITDLSDAQTQLEAYNQQLEALVEERTADLTVAYQQLDSIFQETEDGIITLTPSFQVSSINPAARHWLKTELDLTDPVGLSVTHFLSLPGKPPKAILDYFNPQKANILKEARVGTLDVEISISPVSNVVTTTDRETANPATGFVLVLRDISQRKEMDRLRDDFVSTLTHDLRTPLLAAIQTLGFLEDGTLGELNEKQTDMIQMMTQNNRDLLGLVNVLLEVYKYESGQQRLVMDTVNLHELIQNIGKELQALALQKKQTLTIHVSSDTPMVRGDKQELRRVFINLIGNAIHHTPGGGQIEIFKSEPADAANLVLNVKDTGRGIPAQDIPKLFQRFSQGTSKVRSSGTGLGLYLSRQIIEAHHGKIWVNSTEGKGTCFSVSLPAMDD